MSRWSWCALLACTVIGGEALAADPPDVDKFGVKTCRPCHASTRATPHKWDSEGVLPEYDQGVLGKGTRLPLDTTALEYEAWQAVLPKKDSSKGDTCFSCHLSKEPGAKRSIPGASADMVELHRWLYTDLGWKEKTLGVWVDVDTYRTFLVATVKVLNYGSGHRAPSRGRIELRVKGVDAAGKPLNFMRGHVLPTRVSKGRSPGFLYERTYADASGTPTSGSDAVQVLEDSRLHAGEHDEHHYYYRLPEDAPRGEKAWEISAELVWVVDGKEVPLEAASADSPR